MYYLFKVERCDAINLLSKHETFEDALAAMKESLAKKIKETKGFSITADDLTPENADKYSFEFDTDPSFPFDDEKGPVVTATNYSDDGITEWAIFNVTTGGKFILFKNVEDRYMNVLDTYDTYDDAYDEQGEDETEWYAGASLAPRKEGDESPHVVFVDSNYGKVAPETDIFENGSEICTLSCPTSKSLFDFKVAAAQE